MSSGGDGGYTLFTRSTVDAKTLEPDVRAELGGLYEATEQLNTKLRDELAELRAERDVLRTRVEGLDAENDTLAQRLGSLAAEVDRVAREAEAAEEFDPEAFAAAMRADLADLLDREDREAREVFRPGGAAPLPTLASVPATRVFADFALAAEEADAAAADSGFAVEDLSVTLRTGVRHEDGVALQLPGLVGADAAGLSDVSFAVRPRATPSAAPVGEDGVTPADLREVPPLVGRSLAAARETLAAAGFAVGAVTEDDGEPGRVLAQLPSSYSLAEPGAPVDLTVGRAAAPDDDSLQGTRPSAAPDAAGDTGPTGEETDRESQGTPAAEPDDLERIDGIGPTYAERLVDAGIETFAELAAADVDRVAAAANTSTSRADDWVAAAGRLAGETR
ncbi:helix-hairpin-helix domain-containing protein [Halobaculum litoreum]|uniref:Helix-hairpin-helix domain-containing protein n=1 Tax=Halobaculum litoreum TaxID=3031998 RepID=A0ABD5XUG9_9EURY|nr:helix-hairpin-helix domain-containing protein [Halobaculum sp. DT92]